MANWPMVWTPASGPSITFDDTVYTLLTGFEGWALAEHDLDMRRMGGYDWYLAQALARPREMDIVILIRESTPAALMTAIRTLAQSLNPLSGQLGTLKVTRTDAIQRQLFGIVKSGLSGNTGTGEFGDLWAKAVITMTFPDPFWSATNVTLFEYAAGTPTLFFPFFPLVLSSSSLFSDIVATNDGDAETWPIWTFTGPGTGPGAHNTTTGKYFTLSGATLLAGELLVIDTRPGYKTIEKGSTNQFSLLNAGSELFSIQPGNNSITLDFAGTTGGSKVSLQYYKKYIAL